jgi:hypothetical protein
MNESHIGPHDGAFGWGTALDPAGSIPMCVTTESFRPNYGLGVDLGSNRNEYQEYFLWRLVVRVDNLTTFMCRFSWNLGALASKNLQGMSRPTHALLIVIITHFMFHICCICKHYLLYFSLFSASFTWHISPLASLSKHVFSDWFLIIISRLFPYVLFVYPFIL